jgi:excisionase family DNA binding protein
MTKPDLSSWYTTEEVMSKLRMSQRSVYRLRTEKRIGWARRREKGKQPEPVYNPADVDAIQATLAPAPALLEAPAAANGAVATTRPAKAGVQDGFSQFMEFVQRGMAAQAAVAAPRLFLTIEEASEYSGLSQLCLRRLCKEGAIPSIKDRSVKIPKAGLDAFAAPGPR